jgi:hypothetical protein
MSYYYYINTINVLIMQYKNKGYMHDLLLSLVVDSSDQLPLPMKISEDKDLTHHNERLLT